MSDVQIALLVVGGFVLRYGLPLLFLGLIVVVLRRLDARWQAEARRLAPPAPSLPAGPACWQVNGCAPERRAACPGYLNSPAPCWQTFRDRDGNLRAGCLVCEFFSRVQPASRNVIASQPAHRR